LLQVRKHVPHTSEKSAGSGKQHSHNRHTYPHEDEGLDGENQSQGTPFLTGARLNTPAQCFERGMKQNG
jgi:hypothetical protein